MASYVSKEYYLNTYKGKIIPDDEIEKKLEDASMDVDTLTFNRIVARGFDNLTTFQKDIIKKVVCKLADFEFENEDMINCVLQNYSLNGVSMQFGSSWNVLVQNGIAVKRDTYQILCQTGLCCLSLGV